MMLCTMMTVFVTSYDVVHNDDGICNFMLCTMMMVFVTSYDVVHNDDGICNFI
jgi:hypothetical protein